MADTTASIFPDSNLDTIKEKLVGVFYYELTNDDGEVIETSYDDEPIAYIQGNGGIIQGLEKALLGKKVGEEFNVVIPPEEGYGVIDPDEEDEFVEVPRTEFPPDMPLGIHFPIAAELDDGDLITLYIADVTDDLVYLSHHHPLAGQNLHYKVKVVGVREPTQEELKHGHVHGIDGTETEDEDDHDGHGHGGCGCGGCGCGGH